MDLEGEHESNKHWQLGMERITEGNVTLGDEFFWKVGDCSGDSIPKEFHPLLLWHCKFTL